MTEKSISKVITKSFFDKFTSYLEVDIAIVGAGPSGLVAAEHLAAAGKKVAIYETKLAPGGGTWGGGMLFNEIAIQEDALDIVKHFNISYKKADDNLYTVDSVEFASGLIFGAMKAGAKIFNSVSVEDILFDGDTVGGVVILWAPVRRLGMHVDPLMVTAKAVLDGTGHPSEIIKIATQKAGIKINTKTGEIIGEKPMWAESGEKTTVESTGEFYSGLYASGMAATAVAGGYRMGPIFGGMLKSGKKVAELILKNLE